MKRSLGLRHWLLTLLLAGIGPAGYSCGTPPTEPKLPELGALQPHSATSTPIPASGPAAVFAQQVNASPVSPEEYQPLLSGNAFAAVRAAQEDDDEDLALAEYQRYLSTLSPNIAARPEYQYQLGKLAQAAGEPSAAAKAFTSCSRAPFALQGYCAYLLAKHQVASGQNARAVETLNDLGPAHGAVLQQAARRLRGQAAYLAVNDVLAIRELRADLRDMPNAPGWTQSALMLAQALARSPQPPGPAGAVAPVLPSTETESNLEERLTLLRRIQIEAAGTNMAKDAATFEKALLASLKFADAQRWAKFTPEQQLVRMRALVDSREYSEAISSAERVLAEFPATEKYSALGCELMFLRNKAQAAKSDAAGALAQMTELLAQCKDKDLRSRALFLAGKYAFSSKQYASAVSNFEQLERENRTNSLADDARLRAAEAYFELQDTESFVRVLTSMPTDYPEGDMLLDGVFRLALYRIQQSDWAAAGKLLEASLPVARNADTKRDQEYAGRERYFYARSLVETGQVQRGFDELEALIRERPFSYYMQLAVARFMATEPARIESARKRASVDTALSVPELGLATRIPEPAFERALALLRQGETTFALAELKSLPASTNYSSTKIAWLNARLFAPSDSAKLTQQWARDRLADWLPHWPEGQWREMWELAFPRPHREIVAREAKRNSLRESMVYAVMREESGFDARAVSPAQAYGLMQLVKPTAKHFAKELGLRFSQKALFRPATNIALGARCLRSYQDGFELNPLLAIPGYNAGPGRPRRWLKETATADFDVWVESIPYLETRRYTKRVLASMGAYEFLYSKPQAIWPFPVKLLRDAPEKIAWFEAEF